MHSSWIYSLFIDMCWPRIFSKWLKGVSTSNVRCKYISRVRLLVLSVLWFDTSKILWSSFIIWSFCAWKDFEWLWCHLKVLNLLVLSSCVQHTGHSRVLSHFKLASLFARTIKLHQSSIYSSSLLTENHQRDSAIMNHWVFI